MVIPNRLFGVFSIIYGWGVRYPDANIEVSDPRGSRQMEMQVCPPGSLLAGIIWKKLATLNKGEQEYEDYYVGRSGGR